MFSDRAQIHVKAGKRRRRRALSFRREKFVPKGGPDGGDGGDGGDVVLRRRSRRCATSRRCSAGAWIKATQRRATAAAPASTAPNGDDVEVRVPVGTQVFAGDGDLIADLAHPGARVVLARGGRGGRGNARFVSSTRQVPRFAEVGLPGEERDIELHLKLLADAALVGLPNAGKSSLLTRISNARPKVADYPFTTLQPVLGTVEAPDGRQLVVADVPGLIEGASEGVGLGHEFLAHLERARTLVHVIDASKPVEEQWRTIDAELGAYGAGLDDAPADRRPEQDRPRARAPSFAIEDERVIAVFPLSCATGEGLEEFRRRLFALVPEPEPVEHGEDELADFLVYRPQPKARHVAAAAHRARLPRRRHAAVRRGARARAARRRARRTAPRSRSATRSFELA